MKASLNVDSSRNTVLHNAETEVSPQHLRPSEAMLLVLMCRCSAGETDGVPREAGSPVRRGAVVDHLSDHPASAAVVGPAGVPLLEGRDAEEPFLC